MISEQLSFDQGWQLASTAKPHEGSTRLSEDSMDGAMARAGQDEGYERSTAGPLTRLFRQLKEWYLSADEYLADDLQRFSHDPTVREARARRLQHNLMILALSRR